MSAFTNWLKWYFKRNLPLSPNKKKLNHTGYKMYLCFLFSFVSCPCCIVGRGWGGVGGWGNGPGCVGQPVFLSLSGRREGAESTEGPGRGEGGSSCLMLSDHRCLRSALYMAKPSTAHTVAPTLALSQKVEFFRSAWAMCLRGEARDKRAGEVRGQRAARQGRSRI